MSQFQITRQRHRIPTAHNYRYQVESIIIIASVHNYEQSSAQLFNIESGDRNIAVTWNLLLVAWKRQPFWLSTLLVRLAMN
jgi:hypothetical protein